MIIDENLKEIMIKEENEFRKKLKSGDMKEEEYIFEMGVVGNHEKNFRVDISTKDHTIIIDEPAPFGNNLGPSPVELLLAGYAGCYQLGFIAFCSLSNMKVENVQVKISAVMDARKSFPGPKDPAPRIVSVKIQTIVKSNESEARLNRIVEKSKRSCIIAGSLHPDIEKEYSLEILPSSS